MEAQAWGSSALDKYYQAWGVRTMAQPPVGLSSDEPALLAVATAWYAARLAPGGANSMGLCFAATKIVRRACQERGIEADPLTVVLTVVGPAGPSTVGTARPRLRRVGGQQVWDGHEVLYLPEKRMLFDPTAIQAARFDPVLALDPILADVGEGFSGRRGNVCSVQAAASFTPHPESFPVRYEVVEANYSYRGGRDWAAFSQMAEDLIPHLP